MEKNQIRARAILYNSITAEILFDRCLKRAAPLTHGNFALLNFKLLILCNKFHFFKTLVAFFLGLGFGLNLWKMNIVAVERNFMDAIVTKPEHYIVDSIKLMWWLLTKATENTNWNIHFRHLFHSFTHFKWIYTVQRVIRGSVLMSFAKMWPKYANQVQCYRSSIWRTREPFRKWVNYELG